VTVTVNDELQARAMFDERYGIALSPVARQIERRVIGGDRGAAAAARRSHGLHHDHRVAGVGPGGATAGPRRRA
jgi:hypothetical protein